MLLHNRQRRPSLLFALRTLGQQHRVAFVAHHTAVFDAQLAHPPCQLDCLRGLCGAAAAHAGIDFDDCGSLLPTPRHPVGQLLQIELRLHGDGDIGATCEHRHEAVDLDLADDLVSHKNWTEACIDEHFGLTQLRNGDTYRPGVKLPAGYLWGLWRLEVRPNLNALAFEVGGHTGDVRLDHIEVEEQAGSVEFVDVHAPDCGLRDAGCRSRRRPLAPRVSRSRSDPRGGHLRALRLPRAQCWVEL